MSDQDVKEVLSNPETPSAANASEAQPLRGTLTLPLLLWGGVLALTCGLVFGALRSYLHPFWTQWELLAALAAGLFYLICIPFAGVTIRGGKRLTELLPTNAAGVTIQTLRQTLPGLLFGIAAAIILVETLAPTENVTGRAWIISVRLGLVLAALITYLIGDALLLRQLERTHGAEDWCREIMTDLWFVDVPFAVAYAVIFAVYQLKVSANGYAGSGLRAFVAGAGALEVLVRSTIDVFTLSGLSLDAPRERGRSPLGTVALVVAAGICVVTLSVALVSPLHDEFVVPETFVLNIDLPATGLADMVVPVMALSPTGNAMVYVSDDGAGKHHLFYRRIGERAVRSLAGTEGAEQPFFSPDGMQVGFVAGHYLRTLRLESPEDLPQRLCAVQELRGASWGNNEIVYAAGPKSGLFVTALSSGSCAPLLALAPGETTQRWPVILPSGHAIIFAAKDSGGWKVRCLNRVTHTVTTVATDGMYPRYAPPDSLVFGRSHDLYALPLDVQKGQALGVARRILQGVESFGNTSGAVSFDVSRSGSLAYVASGRRPGDIALLDHNGLVQGTIAPIFPASRPASSPSGTHLAVRLRGDANDYISIIAMNSQKEVRRVNLDGDCDDPVWVSDERLLFSSNAAGDYQIYESNGSDAKILFPKMLDVYPTSYSQRSSSLAYAEQSATWDLHVAEVQENKGYLTPVGLRFELATPKNETFGTLSPQGDYFAFVSDKDSHQEVYVRTLSSGAVWPVSTGGGTEPVWAKTGAVLYYRTRTQMMRVTVPASGQPTAPVAVFDDNYDRGPLGFANYDTTSNGGFVVVRIPSSEQREIVFMPHWAAIGHQLD